MRYFICDLDQTLYPRDAGVMQQIDTLMTRYMVERLGISEEEARRLRKRYYREYGTTMYGLRKHHQVDPDDFLHYVHNIPLKSHLRPNPRLARVLAEIPLIRVVFTNADRAHAQAVLKALGIADQFQRIIDVVDVGYISKPIPEAYRRLLALLGASGPECILVEDSLRNLAPAKALGMRTVLVDDDDQAGVADAIIDDIVEVGAVVKQWLRDGDNSAKTS
ncbi:MAG TPA: pyrimidine 5'-nucleotidase [Anaerolineae bacterium]|nr:pyrimidine 5'-nucleotidase [Anaerolineae bacterium]